MATRCCSAIKNFSLQWTSLDEYALQKCAWTKDQEKGQKILFGLRLLFFLNAFGITTWAWVYYDRPLYFQFVYLSYWGVIANFGYFFFSLLTTVMLQYTKKKDEDEGRRVDAISTSCLGHGWSLWQRTHYLWFETMYAIEFLICIAYWAAIHNYSRPWSLDYYFTINLHAIVMVCMLIELFMTRVKFLYRHMVICTIVALSYLLVNILYTTQVTPVYRVLSWNGWFSYVFVIVAAIVFALAFPVGGLLVRLRDRCAPPAPADAQEGSSFLNPVRSATAGGVMMTPIDSAASSPAQV